MVWLPGWDALRNFFSHQFVFSAHAKGSLSAKKHLKNQSVNLKKKLLYANPIELALEWQKGLEERKYASRAAIAKERGVSRARVTQILNILRFPADQLQKVTQLSERKLRLKKD